MDERLMHEIEREGADALLDAGVSVPWREVSLPFCKKKRQLRVTLRRPRLAGLMAIGREWLKMGARWDDMWKWTKEEELAWLSDHGKEVSRVVALAICRSWWQRRYLTGIVAWTVRQWMEPLVMGMVMKQYVGLLGVGPFVNIIRLAETVNPMTPRLSREHRGS